MCIGKAPITTIRTIVMALCFVFFSTRYFFAGNQLIKSSSLNLILLAAAYWVIRQGNAVETDDRSDRIIKGFSLLYAFTLVLGRAVYETNSIHMLYAPAVNIIKNTISLAGLWAFLNAFLRLLHRTIRNINIEKADKFIRDHRLTAWLTEEPHLLLKNWMILFVAWLPCFISYYPGIFSYDIAIQLKYVEGGFSAYTRHHPPLHTMIWGLFWKLYKATGIEAVASYGIVQMAVLSLCMAWMLSILCRKKISPVLRLGCLIYFALNPVIAIMSIIPVKDVCFGASFLCFTVHLSEYISEPTGFGSNIRSAFPLMISALMCCLFRNNAFYVILLMTPVMILACRNRWKRTLLLFLIPLLLFIGIDSGLYPALGMKEGNIREMLSVPIQQISNITADETVAVDDGLMEEINYYMPGIAEDVRSRYNPRFADFMKMRFSAEAFNSRKKEFILLWAKLVIKYPRNCIDAFLSLNLPYWYPDAPVRDAYSKRLYIETGYANGKTYAYKRMGLFPHLLSYYEHIAQNDPIGDTPVLSYLFSLSLPIWLILMCCCVILIRRKTMAILYMFPSVLLWLTYMAGPVSNFRYIFPLIILYPLYIMSAIEPNLFG